MQQANRLHTPSEQKLKTKGASIVLTYTALRLVHHGKGHIVEKAIITVVGKDNVGIIARVCDYLAENNVNILEISQTIVDGYFNMMMIADVTNTTKPIGSMSDELFAIGEEIGVIVRCQHEEIFHKMHRI